MQNVFGRIIMSQGEIILYKSDSLTFEIEVKIEDETVWLTQNQMVELFDSSKQNISLHISNIFKEGELDKNSVVKYSLTTANDGKKYNTAFYNLDVIISVGYRVKSQRGTQFRIWANAILKDYLLKGYAVHSRIDQLEHKINTLEQKACDFDLHIKTSLPPHEGIFYDGQIFDAYAFVAGIIKSAQKSIALIDNYVDETVLILLSKRNLNVSAVVYTKTISQQLQLDLQKHNAQYPPIEIKPFTKSHDRFLIIDNTILYHIGASLKDLGKKWFAFSKLDIEITTIITNCNE